MKTLKFIYISSLIFWILVLLLLFISGDIKDESIYNFDYYLQQNNPYTDISEVLFVLFHLEESKINFFLWCCDCINFIGRSLGYNYQIINILLFVLILPSLCINLMIIAIFQFIHIKKSIKR